VKRKVDPTKRSLRRGTSRRAVPTSIELREGNRATHGRFRGVEEKKQREGEEFEEERGQRRI